MAEYENGGATNRKATDAHAASITASTRVHVDGAQDRQTRSEARDHGEQLLVNVTIVEIIQLPQTTSAIATATAFGTNASVGSWICVIDWKTRSRSRRRAR